MVTPTVDSPEVLLAGFLGGARDRVDRALGGTVDVDEEDVGSARPRLVTVSVEPKLPLALGGRARLLAAGGGRLSRWLLVASGVKRENGLEVAAGGSP